MFVWTAESVLQEIKKYLREHFENLSKALDVYGTERWPAALQKAFSSIPAISIDYGVMEKARDVRCVIAQFSWTDVGGWLAIEQYLKRDDKGNHSRGEIHALNSTNNLIYCEDEDEKVVIVGLDQIAVVRSGKKTLVAHRDRMEDVKKIIQSLNES
jgi:mannose-1-phosphate guanylyltransferase